MDKQGRLTMDPSNSKPLAVEARVLGWVGRCFYFSALAGLGLFGAYIILRATGPAPRNFEQWQDLMAGLPLLTTSEWIANIGIGMHFFMGTVLVLAWPILLSARIRAKHRTVHRWTGRIYVTAALLAGVGGMSFIFTHGAYIPAASIAFGIWGAILMGCAVMAYVHARAKRFDLHRAWAIRLFAMVLGAWLFDVEIKAWRDLAGGIGFGRGGTSGPLDYAILYLFFVPNLLVAEFFIRNKHKRITLPRNLKWPAIASFAAIGIVFAYAIIAVSATSTGKYGKHLLQLLGS